MTTPTTAALATSDGRRHRSAKTRDAIADALLDLIGEGRLRPTAKEIAERAGVSVRSVYVHFDDLEDLFCVAAKRHYARVAPMLAPVPTEGSAADRAHSFVNRRVELYAKVGAVARASQLQAPFSPTLARIVRDAHTRSRQEIERVFARELGVMDALRRKRAAGVIDVLTSPQAFETMREAHGLSDAEARRSAVDAVLAELEGEQ